jgi:hypothetical protein
MMQKMRSKKQHWLCWQSGSLDSRDGRERSQLGRNAPVTGPHHPVQPVALSEWWRARVIGINELSGDAALG